MHDTSTSHHKVQGIDCGSIHVQEGTSANLRTRRPELPRSVPDDRHAQRDVARRIAVLGQPQPEIERTHESIGSDEN